MLHIEAIARINSAGIVSSVLTFKSFACNGRDQRSYATDSSVNCSLPLSIGWSAISICNPLARGFRSKGVMGSNNGLFLRNRHHIVARLKVRRIVDLSNRGSSGRPVRAAYR